MERLGDLSELMADPGLERRLLKSIYFILIFNILAGIGWNGENMGNGQ